MVQGQQPGKQSNASKAGDDGQSTPPIDETGATAKILDISDARARRQDFASHTGFDTAGSYLKDVRERNGLTLQDISERTHIREQHLRGIETGDLSLLPSRAYVSGFVKTYSEFLGLDASAIVARFREDVGLQAPAPVDAKGFETAEARTDLEKREMSLWAVLAILAFILWCAWQILKPQSPIVTSQTPPGFPAPPIAQDAPAVVDPLADPVSVAVGENEFLARVIERIEPVYPRFCEGRAKPVEVVEATFNITADGRVAGARVLSSTNSCFERSAINALKRWRFSPRQVDGLNRPSYDQVIKLSFNKPA